MNANLFTHVDKVTFFQLAQEIEGRVEYVRGRVMQQQGATLRHIQIAQSFRSILERQLDAADWFACSGDRAVELEDTVRYPDVLLECTGAHPKSLSTSEPVLIVEVLSPSSTDRDIDVKSAEYLTFPTLIAYIVASQDEPACFVWMRDETGAFPAEPMTVKGKQETIEVEALGVSLSLAEIYQRM